MTCLLDSTFGFGLHGSTPDDPRKQRNLTSCLLKILEGISWHPTSRVIKNVQMLVETCQIPPQPG
jgi:hypothetical protein